MTTVAKRKRFPDGIAGRPLYMGATQVMFLPACVPRALAWPIRTACISKRSRLVVQEVISGAVAPSGVFGTS